MADESTNDNHGEERQQISGYRQGPAVPSVHDAAMADAEGRIAGFNLAKEFITGSRLPEEYLPRGVFTKRDIARRKRIMAQMNRIKKRRGTGLADILWIGDQMNIALDGGGRQDALDAIRHMTQYDRDETMVRRGVWDRINRGTGQ
jgi:hypothetical protein